MRDKRYKRDETGNREEKGSKGQGTKVIRGIIGKREKGNGEKGKRNGRNERNVRKGMRRKEK